MPLKLGATGITFHDNSVQTTAGGPVVDQYAIGSYVLGRPENTTYYNNTTIAGSSLQAVSGAVVFSTMNEGGGWNPSGGGANMRTVVNTGSWRCVSIAGNNSSAEIGGVGLWVRYA